MNQKNEVLTHANKYVKNTCEKSMAKLKNLQNENILIPKS